MRYQKFYKVKQLTSYKIVHISKYGDQVGCRNGKKKSAVVLKRT